MLKENLKRNTGLDIRLKKAGPSPKRSPKRSPTNSPARSANKYKPTESSLSPKQPQ